MLKSCSIGFLLSVAIVLSAQKYSEFPVSFSKLDRYDSVMMINLYDSYAHYTENNNPDNHIESSYFLFFNPYNPDYPTEKLIVYQEMDELQNLSGNRTVNKYQRTIWILIAFALIFLIISFICFYRSNRKIKILANNLRSTVKELEIRNVNKDKLFSLISHDLIGPMGTIKSLIELYENQNYNKKDPEKIRLIIHNIGKEVKITYNLLENLLTWSKLQFGKIKYFPEDINLNAHVQENVNLYQKLAKDKHLTIKNSVPDNCIVFADKNLLDIIIRNLLSNAIKLRKKAKLLRSLPMKKIRLFAYALKTRELV